MDCQSHQGEASRMASSTLQNTKQQLATNIKALRQDAGLSQEALAYDAEIDRTYISQLERALVNPSLAVLVRVSEVLEVTVIDLLKSEESI